MKGSRVWAMKGEQGAVFVDEPVKSCDQLKKKTTEELDR